MLTSDSAATAPLAFIIAGVISMASIGVVVLNVQDLGGTSEIRVDTENRRVQAAAVLDLVLSSPGYGSGTGLAWTTEPSGADPDSLERFGLRDAFYPHLNITKFRNLKMAPYAADGADKFVNYEEARKQLGLEGSGMNFHIRAYPTLQEVQTVLATGIKDPNLKVLYIGNQTGDENTGISPTVSNPVCGVSPAGNMLWRFGFSITNTGATATMFRASFDLGLSGQSAIREDRSALIGGGATDLVWVDVPNSVKVDCTSTTTFDVDVYDSSNLLDSYTFSNPAASGSASTAAKDFFFEVDQMYYGQADLLVASYSGAAKNDGIDWKLRQGSDPAGAIAASGSHIVPKDKVDRYIAVDLTSVAQDDYTLWLTHDTGVVATQRVRVDNSVITDFDSGSVGPTGFDVAMKHEVAFIEQLVENFCPAHYNNAAASVMEGWGAGDLTWDKRCGGTGQYDAFQPSIIEDDLGGTHGQTVGDVFWDDMDVVRDDVCSRIQYVRSDGACKKGQPPRLDQTNVIVVGSNVNHNQMTTGAFKWSLEAWVEAGGTLIVFGSPNESTNWMRPVFGLKDDATSSGGISAPDTSHPVLNVADQLAWDEYDNRDRTWTFNQQVDGTFTDVVKENDKPVTAISKPGILGNGSLIVTTWVPYDLYNAGAGSTPNEGLKIMNNFLMQGYRDLFLDYGPEIPEGVEVIPSFRRAQVLHEDLGLIDLDIALFLFPGA